MPYTDQTQYPRGVSRLEMDVNRILESGQSVKVAWIIFTHVGGGLRTYTVRNAADTQDIMVVRLQANTTFVQHSGFEAEGGLLFKTDGVSALDVITVGYFK